jgi:hypothetical protein
MKARARDDALSAIPRDTSSGGIPAARAFSTATICYSSRLLRSSEPSPCQCRTHHIDGGNRGAQTRSKGVICSVALALAFCLELRLFYGSGSALAAISQVASGMILACAITAPSGWSVGLRIGQAAGGTVMLSCVLTAFGIESSSLRWVSSRI